MDIRPLNQKLEIANLAAVGASGVELDVALNVCDARAINGVSQGLGYVAEFEDLIKRANRLKWDVVDVFDCTGAKSPYMDIGLKGFSGKFIYIYAKKFGFIQFVSHRAGNVFLTSIFNWDFYQTRKIRVAFPRVAPGDYQISLYLEGRKFRCLNGSNPTWTEKELRKGVGVEIPPGGICAMRLSRKCRKGYRVGLESKEFANPGEKLCLYAWRQPKSKGSDKIWREQCYDRIIQRLIRKKKLKLHLK
jgi:hypothetical protein